MAYVKSNVCIIGDMLCMGCCGHDFTSRPEVAEAIRKNTQEWNRLKDRSKFMRRPYSAVLRKCGVCRNIIFSDKEMTRVMCPLHPAFNEEGDNTDIREGHCETEHLCKTAFVFDMWPQDKQEAFKRFVKSKDLDWYDFSMGMDSGSLLEEFEDMYRQ